MANVSDWSTTDNSNNGAPPNGAPEGMLPSAVNDTMRANMGGVARWYQDQNGTLVTGGTGNAYTLTTNNTNTALADIPLLVFRSNRASTGAVTLNVDTLGAKQLRHAGTQLSTDDMQADKLMAVAYNATDDAFDVIGGFGMGDLVVTGLTGGAITATSLSVKNGTVAGTITAEGSDTGDVGGFVVVGGGGTNPGGRMDSFAGNIRILGDDGTEAVLQGNLNGTTTLYANGTARLQATTTGSATLGTIHDTNSSGSDTNVLMRARNSIGGHAHYSMVTTAEYRLYQTDSTGAVEKIWVAAARDAGVTLNYNNSARVASTLAGATVTGALTVTGSATANGNALVESTRTITTGTGLSGGGNLSANRTFTLDQATETALGGLEVATSAEMKTGTDNTRALTPSNLASIKALVAGTEAASGYYVLPGGLTFQWGGDPSNTSTGTFSQTFSRTFTTVYKVIMGLNNPTGTGSGNGNIAVDTSSITTTGFDMYVPGDSATNFRAFSWIAIGVS